MYDIEIGCLVFVFSIPWFLKNKLKSYSLNFLHLYISHKHRGWKMSKRQRVCTPKTHQTHPKLKQTYTLVQYEVKI